MYCRNCGKEIPDGSSFCPECGASQRDDVQVQNVRTVESKTNTKSIVGLVISLIGLLIFSSLILGPVSAIVSYFGYKECKERNENGSVLAILGMIIGGIAFLAGLYIQAMSSYYYW